MLKKWFLIFVLLITGMFLGCGKRKDIYDTLLLYNSKSLQSSDINFCKVSQYYGLSCKRVDITKTTITDDLFQNIKSVGMNVINLESEINLDELNILKNRINIYGLKLIMFLQKLDKYENLKKLTNNEVHSIFEIPGGNNYYISKNFSWITREFTGQELIYSASHSNLCLTIDKKANNTYPLVTINSTDNSPPVFAYHKNGKGEIFLIAGKNSPSLEITQMYEIYYSSQTFTNLIPTMMAIRYSNGNKCWHNDYNYANLTIDDPPLRQTTRPKDYWGLDYFGMLKELKEHNFHLTVAYIPNRSEIRGLTEKRVVDIFLKNPDRFSIVQHGNNHDGYEFYKYTTEPGDSNSARPFCDQEMDIKEGLWRMNKFSRLTGIPFGRIMIFPCGICPLKTFQLLKKYNFLLTINGNNIPLGEKPLTSYDYQMYPAEMGFGAFPSVDRDHPGEHSPFFDLFINKPLLLYDHAWDFKEGAKTYNSLVDKINKIVGTVEWKSLDYIAKHLYLERERSNGDMEVTMFSNEITLKNECESSKKYWIRKRENFDVPIRHIWVDAESVKYNKKKRGFIFINTVIPSGLERRIRIEYRG